MRHPLILATAGLAALCGGLNSASPDGHPDPSRTMTEFAHANAGDSLARLAARLSQCPGLSGEGVSERMRVGDSTGNADTRQTSPRNRMAASQPADQTGDQAARHEQKLTALIATSDGIDSGEWWKSANWLLDYYQERSELEAFIDKLNALAREYPEKSNLYTCLVIAHKRNGDYPGAIATYKKAIEVAPRNLHFRNKLGETYEEAGLDEKAIRTYQALIELRPDHALGYHALVALQHRLGRSEDVDRTIARAMTSIPKDENRDREIADLRAAAEDYDAAEAFYLEAIENAPEVVLSYHGRSDIGHGSKLELRHRLAMIYAAWGRIEDAELQCRYVVAKAAEDFVKRGTVETLVDMHRSAGSLEEAVQRNEALLGAMKSRVGEAQEALSAAPAHEGAKREFEAAKEDLLEQGLFLALLYEEIQHPEKSICVHEQVAEALPQEKRAWERLVEAGEQAQILSNAMVGYEKLIELAPESKREYFHELATLHARFDNKAASVDCIEKLLAASPDDESTHSTVSGLYEWNHVHAKAAEHYQRAIERSEDPTRISHYRRSLVRIYEHMGERVRAEAEREKLLKAATADGEE